MRRRPVSGLADTGAQTWAPRARPGRGGCMPQRKGPPVGDPSVLGCRAVFLLLGLQLGQPCSRAVGSVLRAGQPVGLTRLGRLLAGRLAVGAALPRAVHRQHRVHRVRVVGDAGVGRQPLGVFAGGRGGLLGVAQGCAVLVVLAGLGAAEVLGCLGLGGWSLCVPPVRGARLVNRTKLTLRPARAVSQ